MSTLNNRPLTADEIKQFNEFEYGECHVDIYTHEAKEGDKVATMWLEDDICQLYVFHNVLYGVKHEDDFFIGESLHEALRLMAECLMSKHG